MVKGGRSSTPVKGGRSNAPISGRGTTPYNRKYILNNRTGDPSPASGESREESPLKLSDEQVEQLQHNKEKLREILKTLD